MIDFSEVVENVKDFYKITSGNFLVCNCGQINFNNPLFEGIAHIGTIPNTASCCQSYFFVVIKLMHCTGKLYRLGICHIIVRIEHGIAFSVDKTVLVSNFNVFSVPCAFRNIGKGECVAFVRLYRTCSGSGRAAA